MSQIEKAKAAGINAYLVIIDDPRSNYGNIINPHGGRHRGSTDRITKGATMKQLLALIQVKKLIALTVTPAQWLIPPQMGWHWVG